MPNETYYQWTTGGGFSKYAARPSWQATAVTRYLASSALIPPSQWFNPTNRGYPDISALGSRILTIQSGTLIHFDPSSPPPPNACVNSPLSLALSLPLSSVSYHTHTHTPGTNLSLTQQHPPPHTSTNPLFFIQAPYQ